MAAAVSAARNGLKPLLLEKYGFLGGLCTGGLVITTPPLDNGINLEIARRLKEKRGLPTLPPLGSRSSRTEVTCR